MKKSLLSGIVYFCVTCVSAQFVFAAPAPAGYGGADVQNKSTTTQLKRLQIEKEYIESVKKHKESDDIDSSDIPQDVEMQDGRIFNPKFKLNKINFTGNTVIKTKRLEKLAKEIEGQEIYFEDLLKFTKNVSKYYQGKGYITSFAVVPEQEIKDGVVTIQIIESRISQVDIDGERWAREWYLRNIVMGRRGVQEGQVFNAYDLQGSMKELNIEQDYSEGVTTIHRTKDTYETEIKLDVKDRFPITLDMNYDNYGRDITGKQRFTSILGMQNLLGIGDKIYGGTILSSGSTGAVAGYEIPIGPRGTRLHYDFGYSDVSLGGAYKPLRVKGESLSHMFRVTHPFIKTTKADLTGSIGFDMSHTSSTSELFNYTFSDYNLRVLRTALYGMLDDSYGRWLGNLGADFGFHGMGASPNIPNGPESSFFKALAGAVRVQRLPLDSIGILRLNGQYSPNRLYAIEQMQIGGPYTLRGYQPAALLGDYGVTGTAEVRFHVPYFRAVLPKKIEDNIDEKVRLAVFYDYGYVKDNDNLYGYPRNYLHSVGAGTYINVHESLNVQVGFGVPIGDKVYNEKSIKFYFAVNTEFDKLIPKKFHSKESKEKL